MVRPPCSFRSILLLANVQPPRLLAVLAMMLAATPAVLALPPTTANLAVDVDIGNQVPVTNQF